MLRRGLRRNAELREHRNAGARERFDRLGEFGRAVHLDHVGAAFVGVDVLQDEALREGIKSFTDWPTIPQLYVKGEFVGGSDIIREMFQAGELQALMVEKGVPLGEA